jgi:threonine dehydratase
LTSPEGRGYRPAAGQPERPDMVSLQDIEAARRRMGDAINITPCPRSESFSKITGSSCFFKLENLQITGSFKERGALNKLLTLTAEERAHGVIAASAGNHAQGVAFHASRLGITSTIVMPEGTPLIKVQSTQSHGARVVLAGASYEEAYREARRIQESESSTFVHPFDDEQVIAGQGTLALELIEQNPFLELVVVPIGGGGLIAGVATAIKEVNPRIRVIGVEAEVFPAMKLSVAKGERVAVGPAVSIADGIAVKQIGEITFPIVQRTVDEIVTVTEEEIANAILLLLEREKTVVEGAGAVGLAALLNKRIPRAEGRKVALVLSGGNIDVNLISRIIERGLVKDGRLARLQVRLPDRPGALAGLTAAIAEKRANILEIHHDRSSGRLSLGETEVALTLETRGRDHILELEAALSQRGYVVKIDP